VELIKSANLVLRFLLELCALVALAYWGFQTGRGLIVKIALGIGVPLLAAVVWATLVAPNAAVRLPGLVPFVFGLVILGLAAVALAAAGHPFLAVIFGAIVLINAALMLLWGQ
jgi:Protein of unknown function (DUF2568)